MDVWVKPYITIDDSKTASLAQSVERRPFKPVVAGSSPAGGEHHKMIINPYHFMDTIVSMCRTIVMC